MSCVSEPCTGHVDVIMGAISTDSSDLCQKLRYLRNGAHCILCRLHQEFLFVEVRVVIFSLGMCSKSI